MGVGAGEGWVGGFGRTLGGGRLFVRGFERPIWSFEGSEARRGVKKKRQSREKSFEEDRRRDED